jgi:hypothetical protein
MMLQSERRFSRFIFFGNVCPFPINANFPTFEQVNDSMRTAACRDEIARPGVIRKGTPMYGPGGPAAMGSVAAQDRLHHASPVGSPYL